MKILSFLGMILSLALIMIQLMIYFSFNEILDFKGNLLLFLGLAIGFFFMLFSIIVAKKFMWGDKNSFIPPAS